MIQQGGHLGHLHHEGGLAGGEVVAGPDAGEYPVHHPDAGGAGRDKGAHLGHEDDQRHLTHVGGLARHIGAGNNSGQIVPAVHVGVVGDEGGPIQHLLHHRVAALHNGEGVGIVHLGHTVVVGGGHRGEGLEYVHLGQGGGGPLNAVHLSADGFL